MQSVMHKRRNTSHHISFRADSFVPQDFLSQEGSVSEHRKSNWWYAPRSDNKGKKQRESRQSPARTI